MARSEEAEARTLLEEAVVLLPGNAQVHLRLAEMLEKAGDAAGRSRCTGRPRRSTRPSRTPWQAPAERRSRWADRTRPSSPSSSSPGSAPRMRARTPSSARPTSPPDVTAMRRTRSGTLSSGSKLPRAGRMLGDAYGRLEKWGDAIRAYGQALQADAEDEGALEALVALCGFKDLPEKLLEALQDAVSTHPSSAKLLRRLGFAYAVLDRIPDALDALEKATRYDPSLGDAQRLLGTLYRRAERHDEAARAFEAAFTKIAAQAEDWLELARCHAAMSRWQKACDAASKGLAIDSNHVASYVFLGELLGSLGQVADAAAQLEVAVRLAPEDVHALFALGRSYAALERTREAVGALREVVRLSPDHTEAWQELGKVHDALKEPDKSAEAYKEVVRLQPKEADAYFALGVAYQKAKRFDESAAAPPARAAPAAGARIGRLLPRCVAPAARTKRGRGDRLRRRRDQATRRLGATCGARLRVPEDRPRRGGGRRLQQSRAAGARGRQRPAKPSQTLREGEKARSGRRCVARRLAHATRPP